VKGRVSVLHEVAGFSFDAERERLSYRVDAPWQTLPFN
jgi:hypothetical protein